VTDSGDGLEWLITPSQIKREGGRVVDMVSVTVRNRATGKGGWALRESEEEAKDKALARLRLMEMER
jgi:hypothetical protein